MKKSIPIPPPTPSQFQAIQAQFAPLLIDWQKRAGRHDLPWQKMQDPYRVWLSEIMLQQTQVTTVLNYYPRFLTRFPTVKALAQASVDDVLGLWSGLGYYSRARNLYRCAQMVVQQFAGEFPQSYEQLMTLPGIGRSTAAAIAAFCFNQRVSILDGNVKRVLTRTLAFDKDISASCVDKELWALAQYLLPSQELIDAHESPFIMSCYTQGLMDLGASICLPRRTHCEQCPMQAICLAHQQNQTLAYPIKKRKLKRSTQHGYILWLVSELGVWLHQRPSQGIWGGLHSMPIFNLEKERDALIQALSPLNIQTLPTFKHVLTHMDWMLQPEHIIISPQQTLPESLQAMNGQWLTKDQWERLGLPAPIRRLLELDTYTVV